MLFAALAAAGVRVRLDLSDYAYAAEGGHDGGAARLYVDACLVVERVMDERRTLAGRATGLSRRPL